MNTINYFITIAAATVLLCGCKKDGPEPIRPSAITDVKTFSLPGQIGITWKKAEPVSFEYVQVTYFDALKGKEALRLSSRYSDTIIIPGTRAKYGDYQFTLQPFSSTGTPGEMLKVTGKSGLAPKTVNVVGTHALTLDAERLYTDSQEPSEGPIGNLIDGNKKTYFHSRWSGSPTDFPHYIVVDLGEDQKVSAFKFSYFTRERPEPYDGRNHPRLMDVYVSNEFDGKTYDVSNLTKAATLENLPNGNNVEYSSGNFLLDDSFRYIWLQVKKTHYEATKSFAMAELTISELEVETFDPES